ncbi:hypothetical protein F4818DRAFT_396331 [Hypoxylon cercidicola]|nr:hypothetical protein F4818DRAFT_396331 [Hypoxylon cercidicola]
MSEGQPNVQAILAALAAAQTGTSTTPSQGAPYAVPGYQQPAPAYPTMPPATQPQYAGGSYPAPYDLSGIRPVNSGTVQIGDAIAQAKIYAAEKGLQPYERPLSAAYQQQSHDARTMDSSRRYRSRSRSPVRRDNYRDNSNPYRDERRNDRTAREYGRNRSMSPGISRGRSSGAVFSPRGASGRDRGDDDDSEIIEIESSLVGLIIGRNGENLRRVESETSCRVQFMSPTTEGGPYRQCKITGPRARRAEAKASINRIIDDSGMGALARAGLDKSQPPRRDTAAATPGLSALRDGEECTQIMVPDRTVGLIIGRGGETIRDLQERSGCHINIVGESKSVQGLRPVNLIGPPNAAAQAKELILEIVDSDSRNVNAGGNDHSKGRPLKSDLGRESSHSSNQVGDKINDSIYVPSEAVGMIIGKGGETIREMQNSTGCKINVSQSSGPGETEREIGLVGSRDSINRAKRAIEDKVEAVRQKNSGGMGGGRRGPNPQRRDWDNPNYGNHGASNQHAAVDNQQPPAASGGNDPYAMYGGYQQYMTLWYQALSQQNQQQGGPQGDAPPGL